MRFTKATFAVVFFLLCSLLVITPQAHAVEATPQPSPVFKTSFEDTVKLDPNQLNLSIGHWIEFGDYDGSSNGDGAKVWVPNFPHWRRL